MSFFRNIRNTSKEYYLELDDFILHNWDKCLDGKFEFIRKKPSAPFTELDVEYFFKMYNLYIERYGLGDMQEKYIRKQKKYIDLMLTFVQTGDEILLNEIAALQVELEQINPTNEKGKSISQTLIILSKAHGSWINKKEITVVDYKDLIEEYGTSKEG